MIGWNKKEMSEFESVTRRRQLTEAESENYELCNYELKFHKAVGSLTSFTTEQTQAAESLTSS